MLYVDHYHTNPVLVSFCHILITNDLLLSKTLLAMDLLVYNHAGLYVGWFNQSWAIYFLGHRCNGRSTGRPFWQLEEVIKEP